MLWAKLDNTLDLLALCHEMFVRLPFSLALLTWLFCATNLSGWGFFIFVVYVVTSHAL